MLMVFLLALAAGLPGTFPVGDAGWFGSPGVSPRQCKSLLSPNGSYRLSFPVVVSDSCSYRAVTITDLKGRILYQGSEEFSFGTSGDVCLAWDDLTVWVYCHDGYAYFYCPCETRTQNRSWDRRYYGEVHRVFQDIPAPPPWLLPGYSGMHGDPDGIPPANEGFVVEDAGYGWSCRFEYSPVQYDLAFIRSVVMDDMRLVEASFARSAEDEYFQWRNDPGWTDWVIDGTMSMLPSPEGFCTARASWWEFTGGAHGYDESTLYRYARSATPGAGIEWVRIGTRDLIADSTELVLLSSLVVDSLIRRLGEDCDENWVRLGAGPTWGNYSDLVPVADSTGALTGFIVSFSSDEVGPYFSGPQTVFIPVDLLRRQDVQR